MKTLSDSIIIAGPTTTGKSEISAMLARKIKGAIINTDNYYFYADEDFHIGLGLSRDEPPQDIPCYLFGVRKISEPKPDVQEFYDLVVSAAENALQKGYTPIIQGCSFTLNDKLIESGITKHVFIPSWTTMATLAERCKQRVGEMLDEGLLNEAQHIIQNGEDNAWIAQEGIIYRPTIDFVKTGGTDTNELIGKISQGIIKKAEEQLAKYQTLSNVTWVEHANDPEAALEKILLELA